MTTPLIEAIARALDPDWFGEVDGKHPLDNFPGQHRVYQDAARTNAQAALTAITEAGYAVVPVEPTEAMLERGRWEAESCTNDWTCAAACLPGHVYSSMISAAQGDGE